MLVIILLIKLVQFLFRNLLLEKTKCSDFMFQPHIELIFVVEYFFKLAQSAC